MSNPAEKLIEMKKEKDFLICIDSDGCAFDTMEIKHKECFIPNIINYWDLQPVSKYGREAAEFVNLYSKFRGINRFPALINVIDLLAERAEAVNRGFTPSDITALRDWVKRETKLGNPTLETEVEKTGDAVLEKALKWSKAVNSDVEKIVRNVPPFPFVRESLIKMNKSADVIVVSATPDEALVREWEEHDISKYVKVIAGQEMGSKAECIGFAKEGRYDSSHVLMIGDALGDLQAAKKNSALFFPINPGDEEASWRRFFEEALDIYLSGNYAGEYEQKLIDEFEGYLPETPPWKK